MVRGRDNLGREWAGQLLAYVDGTLVAKATRAAGGEIWIAERLGRRHRYVSGLSEVAAQELILGWAQEAAA